MGIIEIKRLIYIASILLMSYLIIQLFLTINQRPKIESIIYDSIQMPLVNALSQNQPESSKNNSFDYQIIGARIGIYENNSSLILKRKNKEYVVQIGEYLDGRYLLESITSDQVTFLYAGQKIIINTEINP